MSLMEKNLLFSFISQPDQMIVDHNQALKDMIRDYPYFNSVHLLLLYNLKKINKDQYDQQLRKSSIYVSDRHSLFNLLHGFGPELKKTEPVNSIAETETMYKEEKEVSKPFDKLYDSSELLEIDDNQNVTTSEPGTKIEFSESQKKDTNEVRQIPDFELDEGTNRSSSFDLIEKFIEENPAFVPNRLELSELREDISVSSITENEDLVTETLAEVYTSQKLYAKAISIYEKLILKFPEKKAYFATRIENLRNNIK